MVILAGVFVMIFIAALFLGFHGLTVAFLSENRARAAGRLPKQHLQRWNELLDLERK